MNKIIILLVAILISCEVENRKTNLEGYFRSEKYVSLSKSEKSLVLDSIFNLIEKGTTDSVNCSNLLELSTQYYYNGEIIKSRKSARKALIKALKIQDSTCLAKSNFYIADTYTNSYKDSAYYYYSIAQKIFQKKEDLENTAKMQFHKAYLLFYDGNYVDCEVKLVEALKLTEKSNDLASRYSYLNLMGICQEKLGNYDLALTYHKEAIKVLGKIHQTDRNLKYKISSVISISNLYEINEEYDKAINMLNDLLKREDVKSKSLEQYAIILNNIAYAKMKKGDFYGVESNFKEALRISEEIKNNNEILYRKVNLGEYYLTVGNINKSKAYLKEALQFSKEIGNYNEYLKSLKFLSKADISKKEYYNDEYVRIKDSITTAQLTNREKYARIEYETSKLQTENKRLSEQNLIILFSSLFTITILISAFLFSSLNTQKKRNKLLEDKRKAEEEIFYLLEDHQKRIVQAKIMEQNRISKELHDGIMNMLYGIRLNLEFFNESNEDSAVEERKKYIKKILSIENEIRKVSHDLRTDENYPNTDFTELLTVLVDSQNKVNPTEFKIQIDKNINWELLNNIKKLHIYRIIQEALHNVNKHAKASNCVVLISQRQNEILIIIEDNGVGFESDNKKEGLGLKNIKERVKELGGSFVVNSSIEKGTFIEIKINL